MNYSMIFILFMLLSALPVKAQKNEFRKIRYEIQANAIVSHGEHSPFWFTSNKHGLSSLKNNSAYLSAGIYRDFDEKKGLTWAYGIELASAWNHYSPFYVQQLYADIKYNCWEIYNYPTQVLIFLKY